MIPLVSRWQKSPLGRLYYERSEGDRRIIAWIAAIVFLALLWLLLWKPVDDWHFERVGQLSTAQATLDFVKANEALARKVGQNTGGQEGALIPVVTRAANAQQLTLQRLQPEAGGQLNVFLEGQSFDQVFQWIAQLEQNNGVIARWVSIRGEERPGLVNAQIRFTGQGGA